MNARAIPVMLALGLIVSCAPASVSDDIGDLQNEVSDLRDELSDQEDELKKQAKRLSELESRFDNAAASQSMTAKEAKATSERLELACTELKELVDLIVDLEVELKGSYAHPISLWDLPSISRVGSPSCAR